MPISIIPGGPESIPDCVAIMQQLPAHFTDASCAILAHDLRSDDLIVALDEDQVVGFLATRHKSPEVAEITWMAVAPDRQRQGTGTGLIAHVVGALASQGTRMLIVKTLAEIPGADPYQTTRRFYASRGFHLLEVIDPYPGWNPGNPCAIYARAL